MITWTDTLPQDKVDKWIANNGEKAMRIHHTNDPRFALWLHYVERATYSRVGVSYQDLEDWDYWSAWDAGMSPVDAAEQMLEDAGWASAMEY